MIAIKAPTAYRPVDAASFPALARAPSFSPVREIAHLMASLDRWVMQYLLAERLAERPEPTTALEEISVAPYPIYIEAYEVPVSNVAAAQKRAEQRRIAKSSPKSLPADARAISAAPATAALSGGAAAIQVLNASTGGLTNPVVSPALALGGSPQTLKIMILVLLAILMMALGFQLFGHQIEHEEAADPGLTQSVSN
jgi:hypothetical protein